MRSHAYFSSEGREIKTFDLTPEEVGLKKVAPEAIKGGNALENARIIHKILDGHPDFQGSDDLNVLLCAYTKNSQVIRKMQKRPIASMANPITTEKMSVITPGYLAR